MEARTTNMVDSVEKLQTAIQEVRAAQRIYAGFTQEQVDRIFLAAATAANQARIPLAKLAVEETGMGVVEDKVIKNHYASEYIYNAYGGKGGVKRADGKRLSDLLLLSGVCAIC